MKIYFSASISDMTPDAKERYQLIIRLLEELGHKVMASNLLAKAMNEVGQDEEEALVMQHQLYKWKKQADLVVIEASRKSFGLGQEINQSVMNNKPVVVLYEGVKPHILRDEGRDFIFLVPYTLEGLKKTLEEVIVYASEQQDIRFNFFISPMLAQYLDWVSKIRRIPRSVYLRRLIEQDMEENEEYPKE